jgi:hypothetical protein
MATIKKNGGPAGFEFDCESEPIAPGTKCEPRLSPDQPTRPVSAWQWWVVSAAIIAALMAGVFIGRFS